ncbi:hypothetical protein EIL87_20830 [Saccharopolyspora rhizosphaerae]|uniref:Uncharacterized protein n=1 Tax=Saccharopolyspora rhizosphaerae TaxID=2492662 RepID=A0A426JLU3_9PSEU|nr:hypothetical protein [Saccharopolyspora rhizosphaerae]RRO14193.1 hypothetical protein EIL87_20830 [Saccharopolyspora rhizosphaerae]
MAGDRIRQLTKRVRDGIAQHNPVKPKNEANAHEESSGRANSLLDTGPRVPPQSGNHQKD